MRIGLDVRYLSHGLVGGIHTYLKQFIPALVNECSDHQIILYADTKRPFELTDLPRNVTIRLLPYRSILSAIYYDFNLWRWMQRDHVDVAHFTGNYGFAPSTMPTVITLQDEINIMPLKKIIQGHKKNAKTIFMMTYLHYCTSHALPQADKVITIVPTADLGTGTLYQLDFSAGLKSTDGQALTPLQRSFTTEGTFASSGAIAQFNFEDNANDQIGSYDPVPADIIDITYTSSRNAAAGKAATFNGTTSLIEIPNGNTLMNSTDFSIAFWVKTNSDGKTGGHFVMGCAGWYGFQYELYGGYDGGKFAFRYELADLSTASEDMWFPSLADLGWQGWTFAKSLTVDQMMALLKDTWLNVAFTYNASSKVATLYYNGEKMKSFDFNNWPTGDAKKGVIGLKYDGTTLGNKLALGFIQGRDNRAIPDTWADYASVDANNHFKGQLDDIRIWHKTLSGNEILLMYNSEKP